MKDRIATIALVTAVAALVSAAGPWFEHRMIALASRVTQEPVQPIPSQIIATPERFNHALVHLVGFCVNQFEHVAIHGTADTSDWLPALWLALTQSQSDELDAPEPRLCAVTGVFRGGPTGHMGRWPAELRPVIDIKLYPKQEGEAR